MSDESKQPSGRGDLWTAIEKGVADENSSPQSDSGSAESISMGEWTERGAKEGLNGNFRCQKTPNGQGGEHPLQTPLRPPPHSSGDGTPLLEGARPFECRPRPIASLQHLRSAHLLEIEVGQFGHFGESICPLCSLFSSQGVTLGVGASRGACLRSLCAVVASPLGCAQMGGGGQTEAPFGHSLSECPK